MIDRLFSSPQSLLDWFASGQASLRRWEHLRFRPLSGPTDNLRVEFAADFETQSPHRAAGAAKRMLRAPIGAFAGPRSGLFLGVLVRRGRMRRGVRGGAPPKEPWVSQRQKRRKRREARKSAAPAVPCFSVLKSPPHATTGPCTPRRSSNQPTTARRTTFFSPRAARTRVPSTAALPETTSRRTGPSLRRFSTRIS